MELVWSDEFDGPAGQAPSSDWMGHWGRWFHSNGEAQFYTPPPANCALDGNGNLAITVRNEATPDGHVPPDPLAFTSARIFTQGTREFAPPIRVACRALVPNTPGLLPAFWMLGSQGGQGWPTEGEIDIAEWPAQFGPQKISYNLHGPRFTARTVDTPYNVANPLTPNPYPATWFEYAIDWRPDRIDWLLDGAVLGSVSSAEYVAAGGDWTPFSGAWPFYVILNVAVSNAWTGPPTSASVLPQTMLVDYVRVSAL